MQNTEGVLQTIAEALARPSPRPSPGWRGKDYGTSPFKIFASLAGSMLPPEMTQTTLPAPARPAIAAAAEIAPAPSAMTRLRSARSRTAAATSGTDRTRDPARSELASGHISGSMDLPPMPSTKLDVCGTVTGLPAGRDAEKGGAVSTLEGQCLPRWWS